MTALAIDVGPRYVRIARIGDRGGPELVELPGTVPGEGLPVPPEARTDLATDRATALRHAYAAYVRHHGAPDRVVVVVPHHERARHAQQAADTLSALHAADPRSAARPAGPGVVGSGATGPGAVGLGTTGGGTSGGGTSGGGTSGGGTSGGGTAGPAATTPAPAGPAPRVRALSTPYVVLALLRHAGTVAGGRYVVCDLGATAAEVAACVVTAGGVAVAGTGRRAPADGYGAGFDAALLAAAGLPDDEECHRALAAVRAEGGANRRLDLALDRAARRPDRYDATVVHQVAGRGLTAGAIRAALRPLTTGLDLALAEALGGAGFAPGDAEFAPGDGPATGGPVPPPQDGDGPHLIPVGGAARLAPLVRHLTARGRSLIPLPDGTDPALAAVFGAALVAAGRIDPADRYPYDVCVGAHRTVAGRPRDQELTISAAGTLEPGGETVFATEGERRLRVRLRTGRAGTAAPGDTQARAQVRVRVRDQESGRCAPVRTLALPGDAPEDRCHVGVRVALDGTARLVLHPLGSVAREFPLGSLPIDLKEVRS